MTIDFLHLYSKCPHCTTMFRVAVTDIEASEGWVKCGHCRKVFDCRENEINPKDFVIADAPEKDITQESAVDIDAELISQPDEGDTVPQIPLFSEPPEQQSETQPNTSPPRSTVDSRLTVKDQQQPAPVIKHHQQQTTLSNKIKNHESLENTSQEASGTMPGVKNKALSRKQTGETLKKRLNITKPQAPGLSKIIVAKAQSWKKEKNRFKKTRAFPVALIAMFLFALIIWQMAVVNYTKLSSYSFLSLPLSAVCSIITCNEKQVPLVSGFEILHANVRRHAFVPNVMSVSAKLINFSDKIKLMPTLRLDLIDDKNTIIASRTIALPDNPQYVNPALTELAPGQDIQLLFNIDNPSKSAYGFQLSLVNGHP